MPRRKMMATEAPWPKDLEDLVKHFAYMPGWSARLFDQTPTKHNGWCGGLRLYITATVVDSFDFKSYIRVRHEFIVPAATYNRLTWRIWLFERVMDVHRHEAGEFFRDKGERVFAPHHGNGESPYTTFFLGTEQAANKSAGQD